MHLFRYGLCGALLLCMNAYGSTAGGTPSIVLPVVQRGNPRPVTVDDIASSRTIDSFCLAPNRAHFAVLVRQPDATTNETRSGWFVGDVAGEGLRYVGDGGLARPAVRDTGQAGGQLEASDCRWSSDGQWIAYKVRTAMDVQLWRSSSDGHLQEQLTHNTADVQDFEWSRDGGSLYFTTGTSREEQASREEALAHSGYRYDDDIYFFTDLMKESRPRPQEEARNLWTITIQTQVERRATKQAREDYEDRRLRGEAGLEHADSFFHDAIVPPISNSSGFSAWLRRQTHGSWNLRLVGRSADGQVKECLAEACSGAIRKIWWSHDQSRVIFWRAEGINNSAQGFYSWQAASDRVERLTDPTYDDMAACDLAVSDRLVCVRETPARPAHVVTIDCRSGGIRVIADANPEFINIRVGDVERFEWDTPEFSWNAIGGELEGLYPRKAWGYILYPPDFDRTKKYPVFIDPYHATGFRPLGNEHPLQAYAANGFVVLRTEFPTPIDPFARLGPLVMKKLFSGELDFPRLSMSMDSTLRGLDAVARRGFIDEHRVGIGGVSQGTFVPLYMLQKYDRLAAVSISSPYWGPHEYYWATRKGRRLEAQTTGLVGSEDWRPRPEGAGAEFWRRIDIADHVDHVEAPILMNLADVETYALLRLLRHLDDADKPYDAYVFRNETHLKWQPAHTRTIMNRNLDWFRFWLQNYEDVSPTKTEQYARWRELKVQQGRSERRNRRITETFDRQ